MIDPNLKESRRYGIQGRLSFDEKIANVPMYNSLEKFLRGAEGIGGAGGTLASNPELRNGTQISQVFSDSKTRSAVQERLDKQLTEHLEQEFGKQSQAQGTSIPEYLKTQGIHGISQNKSGGYTAYKPDNFVLSSQNPLTGSTQKKAQAYLRGIGAANRIVGGSNEDRRIETYLRPGEAEHVNGMVRATAYAVNSGTYNHGDMEALYGSGGDRLEAKQKRTRVRNDVATFNMQNMDPAAVEEMRSKILKQAEQKKLYSDVEAGLRATGELAPEEDKSGSGKGTVAKGVALGIGAIGTAIGLIKTMVGSMLGVLTKISMDMGKLIKDSAELGIDPNQAKRYQNWGIANPTYTGGNKDLILDAMKETNSKYGDITRFDKNANFTSSAYNGFSDVIGMTVQSALKKDPVKGTEQVMGYFAERYAGAKGPEGKQKVMQHSMRALTEDFGTNNAALFAALIQSSEAQGMKIDKNLLRNATNPERVNTLQTTGTHVDDIFGGAGDAVGIKDNTKMLNGVLGDLGSIQNKLYMMLLSNMDIIIQVLLSMAKGILDLMSFFGSKGADRALEALAKTEKGMATAGLKNQVENSMKYKADAKSGITEYLKGKGLKSEDIPGETDKLFDLIQNKQALPEKYKDLASGARGARVVHSTAAYVSGMAKAKDMYSGVQSGTFEGSGSAYNTMNGADLNDFRSAYGIKGNHAQYEDVERAEGIKLDMSTIGLTNDFVSGKGATKGPGVEEPFLNTTSMGFGTIVYKQKMDSLDEIHPGESLEKLEGKQSKGQNYFGGLVDLMKKGPYSALADTASSGMFPVPGGVSGAPGQPNDPFLFTITVDLKMKEKIIGTNVRTMSSENQARSFVNSMAAYIAEG